MSELRTIQEPGKFEGELFVSRWLVDAIGGFFDADYGYDFGEGLYGLVEGPFKPEDFDDVWGELNETEQQFVVSKGGAIFFERSDGFVFADWYDSAESLRQAWSEIEAEFAEDVVPLFPAGYGDDEG